MEGKEHQTNEEFIIPGNDLMSMSVWGFNLKGGIKYNTNTIPVDKEVLKRAGAVFPNDKKTTKKIDEVKIEAKIESPAGYTKEELESYSFEALKAIGKKYNVTDRSKAKLIEEILRAQG